MVEVRQQTEQAPKLSLARLVDRSVKQFYIEYPASNGFPFNTDFKLSDVVGNMLGGIIGLSPTDVFDIVAAESTLGSEKIASIQDAFREQGAKEKDVPGLTAHRIVVREILSAHPDINEAYEEAIQRFT